MGRPVGESGMPPPGGGGIGRPVGEIGRPGGGPDGRAGAGARGGWTTPSRATGAAARAGGITAGRAGMPAGRVGAAVSSPRPLEMTPVGRASSCSAGATTAAAACDTTGATSTMGAAAGAGADSTTGAGATSATGAGTSTTGAGVTTAAAGTTTFSSTGAATTAGAGGSITGLATTTSAGAAASSAAAAAAAAFLVGFLAALAGSSGWTSRLRPSFSARRRTRSPWASSMEDEWLLMPMPKTLHRSTASLLVRPSSFASSWTLIFPATCAVNLSSSPKPSGRTLQCDTFEGATPNTTSKSATTLGSTLRLSARSNPPFFTASDRHDTDCRHSHAPRPGAVRLTTNRSCTNATRSS
jgi:hypothetical protein